MTSVPRLTNEDTGTWIIKTRGSTHVLNLDEKTITRFNDSGRNPMPRDGKEKYITTVARWPEVGDGFIMYYSEQPQSMAVRWHASSTIESIESFDV